MDPLLKDWLTIGFSTVALLISSVSLFISWRNFRRDRSHLKLTLEYERQAGPEGQYQLTVTNDGRRAATLTEVNALLWFRERCTVYQQSTPLEEGKQKRILVPLAMIPSLSTPLRVRAFEARDSVGNRYRRSTLGLLLKILNRGHDRSNDFED